MTLPPQVVRLLQLWGAGRAVVKRLPRRRLIWVYGAVAVAAVIVVLTTVTVAVAILATPAAIPVAVAAKVLGPVAELFTGGDGGPDGVSGEQLLQAGMDADVTCDAAPAASTATSTPPRQEDVTTEAATDPSTSGVPVVTPIPLEAGGAISREDGQQLLNPLPAQVSALKAHVWFLYRLAGLGDWDQFDADYTAAGLRDDDESADAPLAQVQRLNTTGAEVQRYRLTAAALTAAGEQTGRLRDPYPGYRDLVAVELVGSCQSDPAGTELRQQLPPPGR